MSATCEDETFWRDFLTALKQRGLHGVRLVISDQHAGLVKALKRSFQGSGHQRCRVHFATRHGEETHVDVREVLLTALATEQADKFATTTREQEQLAAYSSQRLTAQAVVHLTRRRLALDPRDRAITSSR